ncbi:cystathionine gamma-synthase [Nadsonia fulvescens var. elongata DSM 6958]|uniref:Cystathionine gamma-synthase n=1 Tax=Nadsonia fulvescens var. elongata DSM 6958 TaxID=857566 RepID=A0A1E3PI21_9ASCO|nr:cystathionine gamma-synthase [Nadsonia fulvescens var. elongata DSM 6958]
MSSFDINTRALHGDDSLSLQSDIAPPISVTSTFRYPEPEFLQTSREIDYNASKNHVYSRLNTPTVDRAEAVLNEILGGQSTLYSTGVSAFFAALTYYNPKRLSIGEGYHGCHCVADIFTRNSGMIQLPLDCPAEELQPGDVIHLETPVNPKGEAINIEHYVKKAHSRGAFIIVDSTLAPPPLQDPFAYNVDMIMHSATKYLGGHSDLLAGVLVTRDEKVRAQLYDDRVYLGTICGAMESWLLLRSLRTYDIRFRRQIDNGAKVVKYLTDNIDKYPVLEKIYHASLQTDEFIKTQMPHGFGPLFTIVVRDREVAKHLPSALKLFHHATSLGSVESLIEWRAMSDPTTPETYLRLSIGLEHPDDLIADLHQAFTKLL